MLEALVFGANFNSNTHGKRKRLSMQTLEIVMLSGRNCFLYVTKTSTLSSKFAIIIF